MLASVLGVLFKGRNLARLLGGLWVTLRLSAVSILLSVALGLALGMVMTLRSPIIRALTRLWLETIRIVPQLVLLFIVYFGLARAFNLQLSGEAAAVVVFVFWGAGEMGDLVRGALTSIPAHQRESGAALGLTLLAGSGPRIPISIVPVGSVQTDFETEFEACGINQTRHKVYLQLSASIRIVIPTGAKTTNVTANMLVAESIIVGKVPESFVGYRLSEEELNMAP